MSRRRATQAHGHWIGDLAIRNVSREIVDVRFSVDVGLVPATGGRWVHLRLCRTCGDVGCCDQSPGKHATKHFHATTHPVIRSFEPGEDWSWRYVETIVLEPPR